MSELIARSAERRCNQCWKVKPWPEAFQGARGRPAEKNCTECRTRLGIRAKTEPADRLRLVAKRVDPEPEGLMLLVARSKNKKTGPMPVSLSERGTCPPSCAFFDAGCYAGYGHLGAHWRRIRGTATYAHWVPWKAFLAKVRALPKFTVWRHNEAGDLAGAGEEVDLGKLTELVAANMGRRGFTYTHKKDLGRCGDAYRWANEEGFTVNLSCDSLEEVDAIVAESKSGPFPLPLPMTVVLPPEAPKTLTTPGGVPVVVCPAQTSPGMTCLQCRLCANPDRHSVVGFRGHGTAEKLVAEIVRSKRTELAGAGRNPGSVQRLALIRERVRLLKEGGKAPKLPPAPKQALEVTVTWFEFHKLQAYAGTESKDIYWANMSEEILRRTFSVEVTKLIIENVSGAMLRPVKADKVEESERVTWVPLEEIGK